MSNILASHINPYTSVGDVGEAGASYKNKWGGRDGRREPDSGLGRTQDYRTRWTDDDWVDLDAFTQKMEEPETQSGRSVSRQSDT